MFSITCLVAFKFHNQTDKDCLLEKKKKKKRDCNKRKTTFEFIKMSQRSADINARQRLDKSLYTIDIGVVQ